VAQNRLGAAGRRLPLAGAGRLAASTWALSVTLTALAIVLLALVRFHPDAYVFQFWAEYTTAAVGCSTVGAVILWRRPDHPVGWIFCAAGLLAAVKHFGAQYAAYALLGPLPGAETLAWVSTWIWVPAVGLFVFLAGTVLVAFLPGPVDGLDPIRNPLGLRDFAGESVDTLVQALLGTLGLLAAASVFVRLRRAEGEERQQLKWFAWAAAVLATGTILVHTVAVAAGAPWVRHVGFPLLIGGIAGVPIAVGFAILRHRLYGIDLIVNRALVYGSLTACVVGIYALVVGGLGALAQARGSLLVSLLAAGVVAVLFAPLRDHLQRGVNRLMYGERDDPYAVLSRLGQRLETTVAPDAALRTIVETTAQALKLPYAAIALEGDSGFEVAAEYGNPASEPVVLPLAYQSEPVGRLILAPRAPGEEFSALDRRLLNDLAWQAGAAVHAVRLTADLRRSTERLVTAREEERRRLRRDLHDGLGPRLAAQTLKIGSARSLYPRDPAAADALLSELETDMEAAISDIRRLVYNLRPPALDELGLIGAVREAAAQYDTNGLRISVEAPENLPPLPAAVEVACYRIAQEAMTNVVRHARAKNCVVRLAVGDALELEIADDGTGPPEERPTTGVGLSSMRERAAELGGTCVVEPSPAGGTRVLARLPLSRDGGRPHE
jgi:signal transduction histidine kinase